MLRASILAVLTAASACGPAPVAMPATRASELLERFAAGAADADVCTPGGRALLRGAVRAYGAAMDASGVAWPSVPVREETPDRLGAVDISVLIAFAAGFVEASDFRGASRAALAQLSFAHWPEMRRMRAGARVACAEVVALQTAAARVVMEMERLRFVEGADRVRRQQARLERAQVQMQAAAAMLEARLEAAREG
ncbi:MAG: hypothetical protein DCF16_17900 [Alphaproteobacteria bacterium]|nr:MAG: hypothetical protein DCF16_17900 [Alphaproteobacteria bacterium]